MPAPVQTTNATSGTGNTVTATLSGVTSGNSILVLLSSGGSAVTLNSLTDNGTPAGTVLFPYTQQATSGTSPQYEGLGAYIISGATAGTHDILATFSAPPGAVMFLAEIPGSLGLDVAVTAIKYQSGYNTVISANSITPTIDGDMIVGLLMLSNSGVTITWDNGFTAGDAQTATHSNFWGYLDQTTAAAITAQGTINQSNNELSGIAVALKTVVPTPLLTSVNGGNPIGEGTTSVSLVGDNFVAGMTAALTQPNGVSVEQSSVTVTSSTAATFDLVMEPPVIDQLAFTDSTYTTNLVVTGNGQSSAPFPVTLTPSNGQPFQTLGTLNPSTPVRVEAIPDFVPGDQLEAAGDSTGTTAPPAGTVLHSDGSFEATANFYMRAYIQADAAWTPWTLITVSPEQPGQGFFGEGGV